MFPDERDHSAGTVVGSNNSALALSYPWTLLPPATRTRPSESSVAVAAPRATVIEPVGVKPGVGVGEAVGADVGVGLGLGLVEGVAVGLAIGDAVADAPEHAATTRTTTRNVATSRPVAT